MTFFMFNILLRCRRYSVPGHSVGKHHNWSWFPLQQHQCPLLNPGLFLLFVRVSWLCICWFFTFSAQELWANAFLTPHPVLHWPSMWMASFCDIQHRNMVLEIKSAHQYQTFIANPPAQKENLIPNGMEKSWILKEGMLKNMQKCDRP